MLSCICWGKSPLSSYSRVVRGPDIVFTAASLVPSLEVMLSQSFASKCPLSGYSRVVRGPDIVFNSSEFGAIAGGDAFQSFVLPPGDTSVHTGGACGRESTADMRKDSVVDGGGEQ